LIELIRDKYVAYTNELVQNHKQIKSIDKPDESNPTPPGEYNVADVAAPPSPLFPLELLPATVLIIPVDTVTLRIRLLEESAMYTLPSKNQ